MTAYSGLRWANDRQSEGRCVKGEGKWAATRKAPIPASRPLSGNLSEASRQKKRSRSMKALRRHFTKTGSACGKNVSGGRKRQGRCLSRTQSLLFATRVRNALNAAGMKTIGEVRETSDDRLLSLPDLGSGSIAYLRETLGLPSTDGVRPLGKKPA